MIEFTDDELQMICRALSYYHDGWGNTLRESNCGDYEWDLLLDYDKLSIKISDHLIQKSLFCTD